jgi:hypothetical protein
VLLFFLFFIISVVDINDNLEICSKKVFCIPNEINNIDCKEDVDINNKIKQNRENDDLNVYEG